MTLFLWSLQRLIVLHDWAVTHFFAYLVKTYTTQSFLFFFWNNNICSLERKNGVLMCDDSREITVNSPLFVAFIASGKGSFIFLLCVFRETLYLLCMPIPLYSASFLELWSSSLETTTVLLPTNMVIIISLFQMLCLAIFTDFLRDMFRCTKIQLVALWEIEFRRPNSTQYRFK